MLGQVTGGATVMVTAAALSSIAVTPSTPSVPAGTALQFTATGTYADGSTQNLTASATWSSDNTTVTTIAANGLGSALVAGSATVTATSDIVSGSTVMTVTSAGVVATAVRADLNLNGTWSYVLNQTQAQIPTTGWAQERVPDAPLYDGTTSIWYKNTINIPTTWMQRGRRFFLELEKSGHYAAVYVNGTFMGEHFGQFSPFQVDLTSGIIGGQENEIEIYVHKADTVYVRSGVNVDQSSCPSTIPDCLGNSYRPAGVDGIQRNWVGVVGDITFSWRPSEYISDVSVVTSVRNMTIGDTLQVIGSGSATTVQAAVLDGGNVVLSLPAQPVVSGVGTLVVPWTNPVLWGTPPYGQPKLYMLQTTLLENGIPVDTVYTRFGFREVWVSGKSVLLNGQPLWLSGNYMLRASPLRTSDDRLPEAMQLHIQQGSRLIGQHFHWDDPGRPWLELADEMGIPVLAGFYCNGGDLTQAQTDDVTAWTAWMAATAQEWADARKNHASIVLWRPMDVLPRGGVNNKTIVYRALAAAVRGQDLSARPIADGSDVDTWGQSGISATNSTQCDDGSAFEAQLASETKPLIFKELYGLNLPCSPTFLQMIYQMAYGGGSIGLITQQLNLEPDQNFTPVWFSQSGRGNRPTTSAALPNWITQEWTPTTWSQELATLYTTSNGHTLPDTSPTSGAYQATQIPATAPTAFLVPPSGTGNPIGAAVASDATAWIVVPVAGSYQLAYGDGTNEVLQNVTAPAPPPFP
ncbi:MAG TPA: Ig-like domain-containing protein [Candidatus Sulfotelmatobacter sp.]